MIPSVQTRAIVSLSEVPIRLFLTLTGTLHLLSRKRVVWLIPPYSLGGLVPPSHQTDHACGTSRSRGLLERSYPDKHG